jgi:CheY-like chemotaxis protein
VLASSTQDALTRLDQDGAFDLAIVDQDLEDGGALRLARALSADETTANGPRLLVSSIGSAPDRDDPALFTGVVTRPVKRSALYDALVAALEHAPTAAVGRRPTGERLDPDFAATHPLRVLVAEDNPTNQRLMVRMLERLGYPSRVVEDGAAAVRAVLDEPFDVVLMDVQMPVLDGLEASRRIRAQATHQPHIVAVTANATADDRDECRRAGMDAHVGKPVRPDALMAALGGAHATAAVAEPMVHLDLDALDRLVELTGDRDFVRSLLDGFRTELATMVTTIRTGIDDDPTEAHRVAHSLRSSAANVGATALSAVAARLEQALAGRATDGSDPPAADRGGGRRAPAEADLAELVSELDHLATATDRALEDLRGW